MNNIDYGMLEDLFRENNWTWNIDSKPQIPDAKDIETFVDTLHERLIGSGYANIESGRLMLALDDDNIGVYVRVGTIEGE